MTYAENVFVAKRNILLDYLCRHRWCVAKAAEAAQINRTNFYELMERHGIQPGRKAHRGNAEWQATA